MSFFRLFIVGFFLSCCYPAFAGVPDKIEYSEAWVDSLYMRAWDVMYSFPDSAIYFANLKEQIAKKIGYTKGIINAHYIRGNAFNENNLFSLATQEYYKALLLIDKSSNNEFLRRKALVLQGIGYSFEMASNYEMAFEFYMEGLQVAKVIDYKDCIADLNYNIGVYFKEKQNYKKALEHFYQALEIYNENEDFEYIVATYNIIGILYKSEQKYDSAKFFYMKALNFTKKNIPSSRKKSWFISNIGETYFVQDQYDSAKYYYSQALAHSEKLSDTEKIKWLNNNLGDVYLKQKNYAKAIAYYQKCISLGDEEKIDEEMKRAYKQLAEAYKKTGKYEEAWMYQEKFMAQTTSLQETKYTLIGQNAEHRIKEVQREHQLSEEIAKTTRRKLMSATLALGFSLLVLLYVLKSNKVD